MTKHTVTTPTGTTDEPRAPWAALAAERLWRASCELEHVRPELRPFVRAHIGRLRRVIEGEREARVAA